MDKVIIGCDDGGALHFGAGAAVEQLKMRTLVRYTWCDMRTSIF